MHEIQKIAKTHKLIGGDTIFFSKKYSSSIVMKFFFPMPKRSAHQLQRQYAEKVKDRLDILEKYITQIRRASECAKEGNMQDSFNILSTVADVYDVETPIADFVRGSYFLGQLQEIRDEYLFLNHELS